VSAPGTASGAIAIGLGIGGTAVKLGVVDAEGRLLGRARVPVHREIAFQDFLDRVGAAIEGLMVDFPGVAALGIGVPGVPDPAAGMLRGRCPALPALLQGSLPKIWSARFGIPASFGNDAVCATHGEMRHGAGRDLARFALITLGTGIGGAMVIDRKVIDGPEGVSPQFGCMSLDPARMDIARPVPGMLENLASATAVVRRYRELCPEADLPPGTEREAEIIFDRAKAGEAEALQAVDEAARWLAQAIGIMSNMLNIEAAIIGGGLSLAGGFFLDKIAGNVGDFVLRMPGRPPAILPAALGNDAGVIGASVLALDSL
jgi:glucokinase